MKKLIIICLCLSLSNCAVMKKHPVITGTVIGVTTGLVIHKVTEHNCASIYDGKPYQGTPPCPK